MLSRDKIRGCFLLGACGDTLGAPLEGIKDLETIIAAHGDKGLSDIIEFKNAYGSGKDFPPGRITDDTTMTMTTVSAMLLAKDINDWQELRGLLWQGYLNWGQHQEDGAPLAAKIDVTIEWPEGSDKFWFYCGAGRGTIAALMQDEPGTVSVPLNYNCIIRGKETKGPNPGCGGMMRVAPLALLDLPPEKIFELGCDSAALTHGHPEAFVATGAIALLIHYAARDEDMASAVKKTVAVLEQYGDRPDYAAGVDACLKALALARQKASAQPCDLHVMDALPGQLGYPNPFLAVPVLAHTAYALLSAPEKPDAAGIKSAMALAISHSGDSDSVGAIVGNVLGARYGAGVIPQEWLAVLVQRADVEKMADALSVIIAPAKEPAMRRNPDLGL
ncbi:MAG: ADP-ribosylglycohydrolase family protein [Alphaproteobacteria bacterium]|nr:MAG: ADP-ribosylglycohydrolase family protein [Alphaproteobacteria bacterium]